jgi:DNA-binding NtrC family response regulator
LQGLVQTAAAGLIASEGAPGLALNQYSRALRILAATGESSELVESVDQYIDAVRRTHGAAYQESTVHSGVPIWRPIRVKCHLSTATDLTECSGPRVVELAAYVSSVVDLASEPKALGEESLRALAALEWIDGGSVERTLVGGKSEEVVNYAPPGRPARRFADDDESRELLVDLGSKAGDNFHLRIIPRTNSESAVGCGASARLVLALSSLRANSGTPTPLSTTSSDTEVVSGTPRIFRSPAMTSLVAEVRRIARQNITVMLTGESGTGKEVVANLIHEAAGSSDRPFVVFNCATIPTDMIESQLFGYRRGAFTGAVDSFMGVIRAAEGGTLFLDEIAELPIATQPKLLRFLDALEVQPLGEALPHRVNVRVIAATNANLEQRIQEGRFRADLYYRLKVVHFHIPPLRERREDIRPLAETFLVRATEEIGKTGVKFGEDTVEHLLLNSWPGNVRQLFHEIRRIAAFVEPEATVRPEDLDPRFLSVIRPGGPGNTAIGNTIGVSINRPLDEIIKEVETATINSALVASNWRNDQAAKRLGLSRKGLYLKRRRLGIVGSDD